MINPNWNYLQSVSRNSRFVKCPLKNLYITMPEKNMLNGRKYSGCFISPLSPSPKKPTFWNFFLLLFIFVRKCKKLAGVLSKNDLIKKHFSSRFESNLCMRRCQKRKKKRSSPTAYTSMSNLFKKKCKAR